jgi:putative nucleotidyltransferase with HDIG domain
MATTDHPTREDALALLREYNRDPRLLNHALAVEAVMRHLARQRGENEDVWGVVGLIHDLDYEQYPDQHCRKTAEILRTHGWPEPLVRAAVSHGWGICSDVEPETALEKTLFAVDELTGLVIAAALVRPSRSILDLETKSVMKKWKIRSFAAGADRDLIQKGADRLGVDLLELIGDVIAGLRQIAGDLGLAGTPASAPA